MFSALIILITYVTLALPAAAIGIPWAWLTGDISLLYRWSMGIMRAGSKLGGIRVNVQGRENIPSEPCIFMANHVSNLDPPIMYPEFPFRTAFFLKRSLMKIPVLGTGMRMANFVPVDRDGRLESARESVKAGIRALSAGVSICTFPEGTRSRTGRLLPFKKGPFYLAMESGVPVVPVSIYGSEQMMTKGSLRVHPGTANLSFHRALQPGDFENREQLTAAVRSAITSGLPQSMWGEET
jgi:1-acyl-sn-glycerol-3-phosphate acyltransferase